MHHAHRYVFNAKSFFSTIAFTLVLLVKQKYVLFNGFRLLLYIKALSCLCEKVFVVRFMFLVLLLLEATQRG